MKKLILIPALLFSLLSFGAPKGLFKCANCNGALYTVNILNNYNVVIRYQDEKGAIHTIRTTYYINDGILHLTGNTVILGVSNDSTLVMQAVSGDVYVLTQ